VRHPSLIDSTAGDCFLQHKVFLSPSCSVAGSALPVTAYDKNGFRILLHFAKECPPGRSDVLVVVVSMLNTAPLPVKNIVLQAAVPKVGVHSSDPQQCESACSGRSGYELGDLDCNTLVLPFCSLCSAYFQNIKVVVRSMSRTASSTCFVFLSV